ncbi:hypothetical protein [Spiroplasma turonicum]|uniref:Uncharacterized protein n=1 Tax=Spiroplasma turonicum TaxID=216946 RepID=A0A0K1P537_9MOLU|nr:hypothetical protein [Spiroplasma turonicum]AKU79400.1 hypothetical protein STURON_00154 [Spiroplasma turonicum]ALX70421.1 hypothetical protein STURO_v1c01520 [Spiroplasma turonicum]
MTINELVVITLDDFISYLNNECFKNLKLNGKNLYLNIDASKFNCENPSLSKTEWNDIINAIRQENQETLAKKNCDLKNFARIEMNLISAASGINKVISLHKEFNELGFWNGEKTATFNEKFVLKKINLSAQSLIKEFAAIYENLKNEQIFNELNLLLKKIVVSTDLNEILKLSSELLLKQNQVLNLDYFVDYNKLVNEYNWIHDFVKISHVNAEFVNLIIIIEVLTNSIKDKIYIPTAIKA